MSDVRSLEGVRLSPYDADYRKCPHALVRRAQDLGRAYWDEEFDRFVLSSFELARSMLLRSDTSVAPRCLRNRPSSAQPGIFESTILQQDLPEHRLMRGIIGRCLASSNLHSLQHQIEYIAKKLLDEIDKRSYFDIRTCFATPLATSTMADFLGIEHTLRPRLSRLVEDLTSVFDPFVTEEKIIRMRVAQHTLLEYFEQRCSVLDLTGTSADIVTNLAQAGAEFGKAASDTAATCVLLLGAGITTTADLITNGLRLLLTHPDQLARLRSDPTLMPHAIEEALRLEPPVAQFSRIAASNLRLGELDVPVGVGISVWTIATGCDPNIHANPFDFDITRSQHAHLGFAAGIHACPGSQLARMEVAIAWRTILDRFSQMRIAYPLAERRVSLAFNGWESLYVHPR